MELARLRKKYESILELRLARTAPDEPAPREALQALAREFPGALRDLDALHVAEIHDRIEALVAAELDPVNMRPWMLAEIAFYDAMRGALAAKAWLARRRDVDDEMQTAFADDVKNLPHADDAKTWARDLASIARPPQGRIVPLAIARVASLLGVSEAEATALIFRHPRAPQTSRD